MSLMSDVIAEVQKLDEFCQQVLVTGISNMLLQGGVYGVLIHTHKNKENDLQILVPTLLRPRFLRLAYYAGII